MKNRRADAWIYILFVGLWLLTSCVSSPLNQNKEPAQAQPELILYNWVDYLPTSVLIAFEKEFGVKVIYKTYSTQEEAVESIHRGERYDIVVLEKEFIPELISDQLLARLDHSKIPNYKNISANFRDLSFDPGNQYTIPYHWGTSGLLIRTDLIDQPVSRWSDLWDERFRGKVGLWPIRRILIGLSLKTLGYSANSENPIELEEAKAHLDLLLKNAALLDNNEASSIPLLAKGEIVIAYGWAYDALLAQEQNLPIEYVLPEDGALLWGDLFVIPANSANPSLAMEFINFLLRPDISGQIVNESFYLVPNDASTGFVLPEILNNPIVFPNNDTLMQAQQILPLSEQGETLYDAVWESLITKRQ